MLSRSDNRPLVDPADLSWRDRFIVASEAVTRAERRDLARRTLTGELRRVRRGIYLRAPSSATPDERHLDLVRAYALERPELVVSHRSAAAVWRLPRLDAWPTRIEVSELAPSVHRSTDGIVRRETSVGFDVDQLEGVHVTSLTRTAIDAARVDSIASAVATVDAALAGVRLLRRPDARTTREELLSDLAPMAGTRGVEGARWVVNFADGAAESPGESVSRLQMHRLGLAPPLLQHRFGDADGAMFADFYWPEFRLIGEFDGMAKYLAGASAESTREVVIREKRREERLRSLGERVVRWDWSIALDRRRLGSLLHAAGLR